MFLLEIKYKLHNSDTARHPASNSLESMFPKILGEFLNLQAENQSPSSAWTVQFLFLIWMKELA